MIGYPNGECEAINDPVMLITCVSAVTAHNQRRGCSASASEYADVAF